MKISIIIPVYNSEKYLERCVDSVLSSLGNTSGEILLVDNGSADNSLALIKNYQKSILSSYLRFVAKPKAQRQ